MDQRSASAARRVKNPRIKSSGGDRIFDICNYIFMVLLMAVTLYPFINVLAVSLNSAQDSLKGGIYLLPRIWTLDNYKYIFREATIFHATLVSILRTIIGTVATVFCSAMVAYSISRQDFVLRKFITVAFILTMYFNGGLIPNYLLMRDLQLVGNFWVYILPGLIGVFNLIIIRSFIENLPESILESGRIDGAGDYRTFFSIVLPLTTPVLATVALFSGVFQWNSWFDVFLYNSSHIELSTLQYELQKILQNSNTTSGTSSLDGMIQGASGAQQNTVTPLSVRATMTMVASVPIIMVYPFLQKYFVKGMMVGGVKG
ncbi:carbohydrate ABC transporter permease [Paenibacillus macerans]|uniref:carbohydrate ABC transporter permease n=1 Tax=Paenibacillus TaxID=44249 RepID=UPI00097AFCB5|nr:carbohydrate ABC transporter permease [Paenibacillus macerans]MEC0137415.1 carbohydrate ABC transporter permease [Paenibacillus macerans]OMG45830.1 sugar ABC transporter permease [Paenibacillus macerans]